MCVVVAVVDLAEDLFLFLDISSGNSIRFGRWRRRRCLGGAAAATTRNWFGLLLRTKKQGHGRADWPVVGIKNAFPKKIFVEVISLDFWRSQMKPIWGKVDQKETFETVETNFDQNNFRSKEKWRLGGIETSKKLFRSVLKEKEKLLTLNHEHTQASTK